jgi:hypothetical protein
MSDLIERLTQRGEADVGMATPTQELCREAATRIAELESRLNDFTDPKTPGMVSIGLLNTERETCDRIRSDNDGLRARIKELEELNESLSANITLHRAEKAEARIKELEAARLWDGGAWRSKILAMQTDLPAAPWTVHHGIPPERDTEEWWIESATGRLLAGQIETDQLASAIASIPYTATRIKELEEWNRKRAEDIITLGQKVGELEEAAKAPLPSPGAAAAEAVCHDEQLEIWADEFTMHLHAAASDFIPDFETYGIKIMYFSAIKDAIRDVVGKAFNHPELAKAPLPDEVAGLVADLEKGAVLLGEHRPYRELCTEAAAALERMARDGERLKGELSYMTDEVAPANLKCIAELEAERDEAKEQVARWRGILARSEYGKEIEAATIEKCAQAMIALGGDRPGPNEDYRTLGYFEACEDGAVAIRALAKPPSTE